MIIDDGGKYRSFRTHEENKKLLLEEIKNLTPEEKAAFRVLLKEMAEEKAPEEPSLLDYIGNAEFKQRPVDIETFVKDPYYLGDTCENIFPVLLQDLKKIFTEGYNEVILTGAIGIGKSYLASIGVCRVLYEISCLKDPHKSFGLAKDSNISVVVLSVNETLAVKVAFENIATKIENSPYFEKNFPFKKMKKEMKFPSNIWVAARATTDTSALGLNPISGILDECLTAETKIRLWGGTDVPVRELLNNTPFEVESRDSNGRTIRAEAFLKTSTVQECFELVLETGQRLRASGNHPVATATRIISSDRFYRVGEAPWDPVFEQVKDLQPGDAVVSSWCGVLLGAKIIDKRSLGMQQTYDVCVPEHEVLIADGVLVHNTNFLQKPTKSVKHIPGMPVYDQAESLYNAIKRRMKSRFQKRGKLPGVLFVASSKQTSDDFTARRVRESKNDPGIYVMDYSLWEVKPNDYDLTNCFHVLCGSETSLSRLLKEDEVQEARATLPEGASIIKVPMDFKPDFERSLEESIRDIAGMATAAISPFITRREKITEAEEAGGKREHPFTTEVYDMSRGGSFIWSKMVHSVQERNQGGGFTTVLKPIVSPNQVRHIHIDPSLRGDCSGFTMAHVCGWKDVQRRNDTGQEYMERAPVYFIDVTLRIVPPIGGEIILGDIRRLVYELSAHGYIITRVTQDQFQSADGIQMLNQRGYTSEIVSVDVSIDPYDNLKLAYYENRIIGYPYDPLRSELRTLELNLKKNKVDHPPRGRKDVADSMAGCLWTLSQAHINAPLPIMNTSSFNTSAWVSPEYAAVHGGNVYQGVTSPLPQGSLPPFMIGNSGGDWGDGWDF